MHSLVLHFALPALPIRTPPSLERRASSCSTASATSALSVSSASSTLSNGSATSASTTRTSIGADSPKLPSDVPGHERAYASADSGSVGQAGRPTRPRLVRRDTPRPPLVLDASLAASVPRIAHDETRTRCRPSLGERRYATLRSAIDGGAWVVVDQY
ncbi:hypothetical protein Q5752_005530 [Cryptotrichosporon argae]